MEQKVFTIRKSCEIRLREPTRMRHMQAGYKGYQV